MGDDAIRRMTLHGHSVAYRQAGSGPVVVLVHGITSSSATWERVIPDLARRFTVIAPDLAGHGESDKPKGDYSLGAHASTVRDLLRALGHERATFVGHSLGGGIAMQFSYQFPERCERLVLVDSGGLGRDVNWLLRAATLPGSELVLPLLAATRLLDAGARAGVEQAGCREEGENEFGAGKRCGAKQPVDVAAEAAAVDQDESLAALGELVGELHRDPSAERVPH